MSTKKFTYQDYLELPEEPGYRFEVLEGLLVKERPRMPFTSGFPAGCNGFWRLFLAV
jgi:hypothetical protein